MIQSHASKIKQSLRDNALKADKIFLFFLWAHVPLAGFILSYSYGTWREGLVSSLIVSVIGTISYVFSRGTLAHRILNGLLLMSCSIILISIQYGRIEMHFHVFATLPFLLYYKDWRVYPFSATLIAVQHATFNYCQSNRIRIGEFPLIVFNYGSGWDIVFLHASFVVVQVGVLIYYAANFRKQHVSLLKANDFLNDTVEEKTASLREEIEKRQLAEKERLASARMASVGEMAGGVAHEINTPLGVIVLSSQNIRGLVGSDQNDSRTMVLKMLDLIDSTTEKITEIIRALKVFATDPGQSPMSEVSLVQVIDEVSTLLKEKMLKSDVNFMIDRESFEGVVLECRETEIVQALHGVIDNARFAASESESKTVKIACQVLGDDIEIKVVDSGSGIDPDDAQRIFEPFFTTREIGQGTGLGLSATRGIVASHGGKIWLDLDCSETTFIICLPRRNPGRLIEEELAS